MSSKDLLTTGKVAGALGVTINTVKNWVAAGRITAVRLPSGHYRIPRSELERLLRGRPAGVELRRQAASRAEGWRRYESWRRTQPVREQSLSSVLAWADAMLALALANGPIPEPSLEEKAERVRRLHERLAPISS